MSHNNGNDNDLHVVYAKQMQTHKRETISLHFFYFDGKHLKLYNITCSFISHRRRHTRIPTRTLYKAHSFTLA